MATKFATKAEAQAAIDAHNIPCAGPVAVTPITARVLGITTGWYIGFPPSISREFVSLEQYHG